MIRRIVCFLSQWLICSWYHKKHRCYPEVWDRGLDGPWHCHLCYPCGDGITELVREQSSKEEFIKHCEMNGIRRTWLGRYKKMGDNGRKNWEKCNEKATKKDS